MSIRPEATTGNAEAEQVFLSFLDSPPDDEPFAQYHWLHEHAPVFTTTTGMVVLTRYDDVDLALRHRAMGRGDESVQHLTDLPPQLVEPVMALWKRTMVFANPPLHTRMRRPVAAAFTPRHVEELRARIVARIERLLGELTGGSEVDWVKEFASPLGTGVVGDMLGVPEPDRPELARLSPESMKVFDPMTASTDLPAAAEAVIDMADYFGDLVDDRRREPGEDVVSRLAGALDAGSLERIEVVAASANLLNAGSDTLVNLLSNAMYALLTNPDQLAALPDLPPALLPRAVEELARWDPPLNLNPRTALEPCAIAGVDLVPGQIVIGVQGAANRDPGHYTDPDRLDLTRDEGPSLSFGGGVHYCLGAHLGRLVLGEVLRVLAATGTTVAPAGTARRRPGHNLRGFQYLPVTLTR
ncbi:cytochrome P450 [Micromonospora auratinigra]|uniref:Cytochrome P450 n=1 Tax=Micromonospora auratinigra TaxID=261654 RepID=A0A1A8ZGV5_9ACTN|nr:cytochrome P450 [Micromonospora auratinigra]SBT43073.1 Cytochrome P450 [Micromonospora auratinigra]